MDWISTKDIRGWANSRSCQATLPQLVRRLIRATCQSVKRIEFPSGENVSIGGWDGILEISEETEYLPKGISLWEFGVSKGVKEKADDDYEKRTKNPLGFDPSECTFIFVTPRIWTKGEEWRDNKMKDGKWKDIKVINAGKLEEWLEIAPTVAAWLTTKHLGKYPPERVQSTNDFWEEWATGPDFILPSEILLGGREIQSNQMIELSKKPKIISVQGTSRNEAQAFIIASFKNDVNKEDDFFARSLIIDDIDTFRRIAALPNPLILIPRFDNAITFHKAVKDGHTVIVPLSPDSSDNWEHKIILPRITRDKFLQSLRSIGVEEELAERYSKESARNLTIFRRQLKFDANLPLWANSENVREIIPAMIIGGWDENFEADKNAVAKLAGETYDSYSAKLSKWLYKSDSPFIKIGKHWRLASPLDAWSIFLRS